MVSNNKTLLYEHRIPKAINAQSVVDSKGIVRQIIPYGEITQNAPAIGNSVANIVGAIKGNFGFPFGIVPELVGKSFSGIKDLKEESKDQEVYKINYVDGIDSMKATISDGTVIEINLSNPKNKTEMSVGNDN